ncbi:hypothetical protein FRC96_11370 [Lujinxingia vulgaris]|uniref:Uncharacterized protein n=2 Tax=Lujinxingia vulgaris TaxID=2600176 RepID=A0A5C6X0L2_9DELT|nr:hypothetical protein FRC96_11370 [Lujinxingia vulgaris]
MVGGLDAMTIQAEAHTCFDTSRHKTNLCMRCFMLHPKPSGSLLPLLLTALLTLSPTLGCGGEEEADTPDVDAGDPGDVEDASDGDADADAGENPDADPDTDAGSSPDADAGENTDTDEDSDVLDPPPCLVDEYVDAGTCTACPAGTTNEAGDDPSGEDTSCDPILCAADERVDANTCVPCGAELSSVEGADASGPDTQCFSDDACFTILGVDCDAFNGTYFKAAEPNGDDQFGQANAINADATVLVTAAPYDDAPGATGFDLLSEYGAVHIFTRDDETWSLHSEITASNQGVGDNFGLHALAIDASGDTLIVGAPNEDSGPDNPTENTHPDAGAVYVFERQTTGSGDAWVESAILKASDLIGGGDRFGSAVDISPDGNTIVVGAPLEDSLDDPEDFNATDSGAAYVFFRDDQADTGWREVGFLKADNASGGDGFGGHVAVDGTTIAIGAQYEDSTATGVNPTDTTNPEGLEYDAGAVYVFSFEPGVSCCTQEAYIKASNTDTRDRFGYRVELAGDVLAVNAPIEKSNASGIDAEQMNNGQQSGAVYVFRRTNGTWAQEAYIKSPLNRQGHNPAFGQGLGLNADGSMLAIGAFLDDSSAVGLNGEEQDWDLPASGAVFLFAFEGGQWTYSAFLKAPNSINGIRYGQDPEFSASGEHLAIGAYHESGNSSGIDGDMNSFGTTRAGALFMHRVAPW